MFLGCITEFPAPLIIIDYKSIRKKKLSECSFTIIDMKTIKQTHDFLVEYEENLPKSNKYYFFLDPNEKMTSAEQSYILFSHMFFDKVLNAVMFQQRRNEMIHVYLKEKCQYYSKFL